MPASCALLPFQLGVKHLSSPTRVRAYAAQATRLWLEGASSGPAPTTSPAHPSVSPRSLSAAARAAGSMEEITDESGGLGALDIAGVVVHAQRRSGGGAETGEATESGGGLGFSRAKLGRDEDIGAEDGPQRRKDGADRGQHAALEGAPPRRRRAPASPAWASPRR